MKAKEDISRKLLDAIEHIDTLDTLVNKNVIELVRTGIYADIRLDTGVAFKSEAIKCIEEALTFIFDSRKDISETVSEEFIWKRLREICEKAVLNEERNKYYLIIKEVGNLLKDISKVESRVFFFRVFNLKCSTNYDFGYIKLYPDKPAFLSEISELYPTIKESLDKFLEDNDDYSIAKVHISSAEDVNAKKNAFYKLDQFLNIWRSLDFRDPIWIEGEASPTMRIYHSYNENTEGYSESFEREGITTNSMDLDKLYQLNPDIMNKLESIWKKEARTPLEEKIINSLIWLGDAIKEKDKVHKLVKMIISLESLLLDKEQNKKNIIQERCAFVLSNDYTDRIEIKGIIEKAYNFRNKIVHEGQVPFIPMSTLLSLHGLIIDLNVRILMSDDWQSIIAIKDFVEEEKYK